MSRRHFVGACTHLLPEVEAAVASLETEWSLQPFAFPATCGRPPLTWEMIENAIPSQHQAGDEIVLLGSACLQLLGPPPGHLQPCVIHCAGQCAELLLGREATEDWMRRRAYLLTSGWLAGWQQQMAAWGLDATTARELFAETTRLLVLLDSRLDPDSTKRLQAMADFLALPCEIVPLNLELLRLRIHNLLLHQELSSEKQAARQQLQENQRRLSDYAMSHELILQLGGMKSEQQTVKAMFDFFTMLFAPASITFLPLQNGLPGMLTTRPIINAGEEAQQRLLKRYADPSGQCSATGFCIALGDAQDIVGLLEMEGIAFAEYRQHYLNLARSMARVCGLVIRAARAYELLEKTAEDLRAALMNVKTLRGLIPICAGCKSIRNDQGFWDQVEIFIRRNSDVTFTHGLCPHCVERLYPEYSSGNDHGGPTDGAA